MYEVSCTDCVKFAIGRCNIGLNFLKVSGRLMIVQSQLQVVVFCTKQPADTSVVTSCYQVAPPIRHTENYVVTSFHVTIKWLHL